MQRLQFLGSGRLSILPWLVLAIGSLPTAACGDDVGSGFVDDPPDDQGPPIGPSEPPPTGSKWEGVLVDGGCGRAKLAYVLIDEVCGGTDDPAYMDYFHAPIMRDGALIGQRLYAVDATQLWVLDVADPQNVERTALLAGFGQPMAVATHGGRVLLAAGDDGLIIVDVSVPDHPTRAADLLLDGPALDVYVDGDVAYLATGKGGVAVVDLAGAEPVLLGSLSVPGFAAAVAARDGIAYVAACDTFATIDVASGALLGQGWVEGAVDEHDILVAPAKDVLLFGDSAFVAAGRFGAVRIDIADPAVIAPSGNCTLVDEQAFYASGVREQGGRMFIAGGEYGILPVDVTDLASACRTHLAPQLPPPPADEVECSSEPPWEVVPWVDSWAPPPVPPEGRDPLQTLPTEGRVFAFGDATRIGLRAIDIRKPDELDVKLGRYSEPRLTEGIAAQGALVAVAGKAGGVFQRGAGGELSRVSTPIEAKHARAAAFLGDGRWVFGGVGEHGFGAVHVEGRAEPLPYVTSPIWAGGLAAKAATVYVPVNDGVLGIDLDGTQTFFSSGRTAQLPQSIAVGTDHLLVAAPEWTEGLRLRPAGPTSLAPVGVFDASAIADVGEWRRGLPRRVVLVAQDRSIEVASLGGSAGITVHGAIDSASSVLPPGDYVAAAIGDDRVFAIAVDRGRYRTQLVTIDTSSGEPVVGAVVAFAGLATGVAAVGSSVYVADGDRGVRVYDGSSGVPELVQLLELSMEVEP